MSSKRNKIIIITGVSGSGKDFLLSKAKIDGYIPSQFDTTSFGERLFKSMQKRYPNIKSRDQLKKLPYEKSLSGWPKVIDQILADQPTIINAHVVLNQQESLIINPAIDDMIRPTGYIFVWAEPRQILEWRKSDSKMRTRLNEPIDQIALHQNIALSVTKTIADHVGAKLLIIRNKPDNVKTNLLKLRGLVKLITRQLQA